MDRRAPLLAGLAVALPTLVARYPPMTDLPLHEGVVGLLRHFGDEAYAPRDLYVLNLGHTNQLFYAPAWLLSLVLPTDWAVKIVVAATQLLIFVFGARLADHLGRPRWSALLLAPLALGYTYYWGLVTNLVGFAAFLAVLPALDRASSRPTPLSALKVSGLLVILFLAHESVWAMALGVIALFAMLSAARVPKDVRGLGLQLAPVASSVGLGVLHRAYERRFYTPVGPIVPIQWKSLIDKVTEIPNTLFGEHEAPVPLALFGAGLVAFASMIATRAAAARATGVDGEVATSDGATSSGERVRAWAEVHRFEMIGLGLLAGYFAMPYTWNAAIRVHERFLGPAWAVLAIAVASRGAASRLTKALATAIPVGVLLVAWPHFLDADHAYRALDEILTHVPKRSSLVLVVMERNGNRLYSASTGGSRVLATRGGRINRALTSSPLSPVQVTPAYRWDDIDERTKLSSIRLVKPAHDLRRFGFLLLQSHDGEAQEVVPRAIAADAREIARSGEWVLFASKHESAALASPDVRADPRLPAVWDLFWEVVERERAHDAK